MADVDGNAADVEALISGHAAVTAIYAVISARFLAEGTDALASALSEPYSPRRTDDAALVIEALRQHMAGLTDAVAGVGIWLRAAHERGDAGEPGILVDRLTGIAEQTRALATQLGGLDVPEDTGPAIDIETLVQQVTAQLCRGGP